MKPTQITNPSAAHWTAPCRRFFRRNSGPTKILINETLISNEMARVLVSGSRSITSKRVVFIDLDAYVSEELDEEYPSLILHGGAEGVDSLAERWANKHSIPTEVLKPEWKKDGKYNKGAGQIRNRQLVDLADRVVAIWDQESKGTEGVIKYCQKINKPLKIFYH